MNEEEKEAIEILNTQLLKTDGYDRHQKAIDIILKLIDNQQKEIEELKYKNSYYKTIAERFLHKGE